mmetsp:Transcript_25172/g.43020  ORF Transcript_25172/g.43020 Transcript_25172/m.43020 type:complete len:518 (-) Transcript_25172:290-1843(-)
MPLVVWCVSTLGWIPPRVSPGVAAGHVGLRLLGSPRHLMSAEEGPRWLRGGGGALADPPGVGRADDEALATGGSPAIRELSFLSLLRTAWRSRKEHSFHKFMLDLRRTHGDAMVLNLWPVLPPMYVMMGKAANRAVLFEMDASLEQVLQDLLNALPISARIPSEVDERLQARVGQLFQSEAYVNERLPAFLRIAEDMRGRWLAQPRDAPLDVFFELSEFVLRSDLEVLFGPDFTSRYADRILPSFRNWVENISDGQVVGFFEELGGYLREAIDERKRDPSAHTDERSVLQVYLADGALERHDVDSLVGLLTMTLMAAVFNTQVSLAWILVHLYSEPALLERARAELATCSSLSQYSQLSRLSFLNACIDESVRLHTMLPGNTVLRKALADVQFRGGRIPEGSLIWLYPNAVHQDEAYFTDASSFCPMRLLSGDSLRQKSAEFELVTFGHGQKRCIGEKMARAMIGAFLGTMLPTVHAEVRNIPDDDNLFDLIPASKLQLHDVTAVGPAGTAAQPADN